jgi:hypothetical protein
MSKKIKVRIQGTETIAYNQIVEMTMEEYEEYKEAPDEAIEGWIDKRDVDNGYGFVCDLIEQIIEPGEKE